MEDGLQWKGKLRRIWNSHSARRLICWARFLCGFAEHRHHRLDGLRHKNDPHGHEDWPPHMHMILWWAHGKRNWQPRCPLLHQPAGTSYAYYCWTLGAIGVQSDFPIGSTFTDTDIDGDAIYFHTVTQAGLLRLGRAGGSECLIRPMEPAFRTARLLNARASVRGVSGLTMM